MLRASDCYLLLWWGPQSHPPLTVHPLMSLQPENLCSVCVNMLVFIEGGGGGGNRGHDTSFMHFKVSSECMADPRPIAMYTGYVETAIEKRSTCACCFEAHVIPHTAKCFV